MLELNTGTRELSSNWRSNQAVSLQSVALFRSAAPVGLRPPFRCQCTTIKKTVASTSHCFFCATLPHLHTLPTLHSSGLPHPPYRFIQLQSASYLPLYLSRRLSAAPYSLGGCSFAQPSGSAPLALRPKSRYAIGGPLLFPRRATLASLRSTT